MKTFKKVFVAIDDSQPSQHAIDYAALLARREDATITFCHSVSLASRFERRTSVDVPRNLERLAALRQHARELLAGAQATASGRAISEPRQSSWELKPRSGGVLNSIARSRTTCCA